MTKKYVLTLIVICILTLVPTRSLTAHCQVPCGIYGDQTRLTMMNEHITTIEKAINKITALSTKTPLNYNQVVRWVTNKEKHAEELSGIVTYYFLAQRVKPVAKTDTAAYATYMKKLELLHHILVYAMKAKQKADLSYVKKLRETVKAFEAVYLKK